MKTRKSSNGRSARDLVGRFSRSVSRIIPDRAVRAAQYTQTLARSKNSEDVCRAEAVREQTVYLIRETLLRRLGALSPACTYARTRRYNARCWRAAREKTGWRVRPRECDEPWRRERYEQLSHRIKDAEVDRARLFSDRESFARYNTPVGN